MDFTFITPKGTELKIPVDSEVTFSLDGSLYVASVTKI